MDDRLHGNHMVNGNVKDTINDKTRIAFVIDGVI